MSSCRKATPSYFHVLICFVVFVTFSLSGSSSVSLSVSVYHSVDVCMSRFLVPFCLIFYCPFFVTFIGVVPQFLAFVAGHFFFLLPFLLLSLIDVNAMLSFASVTVQFHLARILHVSALDFVNGSLPCSTSFSICSISRPFLICRICIGKGLCDALLLSYLSHS